MYGFALKMNPDDLEAVAAQTLRGGAQVRLHLDRRVPVPASCRRTAGPTEMRAEMSLRCLAAAEAAGIAITLLPALYCHGGFGGQATARRPAALRQRRRAVCGHPRAARQAGRANPRARLGIAPHSLRAVTGEALAEALSAIDRLRPGAPVHIHVAEQTREVDDCVAFCGKRPVELLLSLFELSPRWCLIHATHMNETETAAAGEERRRRRSLSDHRGEPRRRHLQRRAVPRRGRRHGARLRQPHLDEPGGGNPAARIFAAASPPGPQRAGGRPRPLDRPAALSTWRWRAVRRRSPSRQGAIARE